MMRENPARADAKPTTLPTTPAQSCEALLATALAAHSSGDYPAARRLYQDILLRQPHHPVALHHLGLIEHVEGRHDRAIDLVNRALAIAPAWSEAHSNLAAVYRAVGDLSAAKACAQRAIALNPGCAPAYANLGGICEDGGETAAAIAAYLRACNLDPHLLEPHLGAANLLHKCGRRDEALAMYKAAADINPKSARIHFDCGNLLRELSRPSEAIEAYRHARALQPDFAEAHHNLGDTLHQLGAYDEAIAAFHAALALNPNSAKTHCNLGAAYECSGRKALSTDAYRRALACDPGMLGVALQLYHQRRSACDWTNLEAEETAIAAAVPEYRQPLVPFHLLDMNVSPQLHLHAARLWASGMYAKPSFAHRRPEPGAPKRGKLKIGYLSADFNSHATALLMADLVECHDRDGFEIVAYSHGKDDASEMRQRLLRACDAFVDLRSLDDRQAAQHIFDDGIDILVELKGYTQYARTNIAAHRPAPVQVNFLGYPGTMGADFIDYILADPVVLPMDDQTYYSEKIVHLPDCYQPNDRYRKVADSWPTRRDYGLPEHGFVFCCFNNSYKITPKIFDVWTRLLRKVEGSVLWLFDAHPNVKENLTREAEKRGIDATRLVFAPRVATPDHVARQRFADLFLDTLPYNAHTTASEALWVGLPVLTLRGTTFAGRVAASLLYAIDLPELVTETLEDYEAQAFRLATQPEALAELRRKLAANRATHPLFDTPRFARHIESAFGHMWDNWAAGEAPQAFRVAPILGSLPRANATGKDAAPGAAKPAQICEELLADALARHGSGHYQAAQALYHDILLRQPKHPIALHNLGLIEHAAGRYDHAIELVTHALAIAPAWSEAHSNLAAFQRAAGDLMAATASAQKAIALDPSRAAAHVNLGAICEDRGETTAALAAYLCACERDPNLLEALLATANLLRRCGRAEEALRVCDAARKRHPHAEAVHFAAGNVLRDLSRSHEAIEAYRHALALRPAFAEVQCNLGNMLHQQGAFAEAIAAFHAALALNPNMAEAHCNLGTAYECMGELALTADAYRRALACDPNFLGVRLKLYHQRRSACDWTNLEAEEAIIAAAVPAYRRPLLSFPLLGMDVSPDLQSHAARLWAAGLPAKPSFPHRRPEPGAPGKSKLKIGYLSADFKSHAVAVLIVDLFACHDRACFEIVGYSYGDDDGSELRQRLARSFDAFVDLRALNDRQAAQRIFDDGIDILVDLTGYTQFGRTNIAAHRPAPVQVNFLGYPGTMGADFIDYILADPVALPMNEEAFYSEKIVHLPDCYQPNDRYRQVADSAPTRSACGLPEHGFVFCCFNNSYKITPKIFDVWMRLLRNVEGSVLWLFDAYPNVRENLVRQAEQRRIDATRLIFAPRVATPDHLARQRLADLFLDTLPYNAHTTASEALWVGLPVLTLRGTTFAGRVAASLLHAIGLPELVTETLEDYEAQAYRIATQPEVLGELRRKLVANRATHPLFDTPRFARHIENAFRRMWDIWTAGEAPQAFRVAAIAMQKPAPEHNRHARHFLG
jgi:predicted O-linked N-acetylglucosamine transferase (SPINDLY family)